jgi:hypothetical protein
MEMPQKDMEAFQRVVLAGMKLMYDQKTFGIFKTGMMRENVPVAKRLAAESAGLMKMLYEKSNRSIPLQIIAPAAAMLLMEMGKFMTEAGVAKVSSEDVRQGTQLLMALLKKMFGKQPPAPAAAQPPAPTAPPPAGGLIQAQGA